MIDDEDKIQINVINGVVLRNGFNLSVLPDSILEDELYIKVHYRVLLSCFIIKY